VKKSPRLQRKNLWEKEKSLRLEKRGITDWKKEGQIHFRKEGWFQCGRRRKKDGNS